MTDDKTPSETEDKCNQILDLLTATGLAGVTTWAQNQELRTLLTAVLSDPNLDKDVATRLTGVFLVLLSVPEGQDLRPQKIRSEAERTRMAALAAAEAITRAVKQAGVIDYDQAQDLMSTMDAFALLADAGDKFIVDDYNEKVKPKLEAMAPGDVLSTEDFWT